MVALCLELFEAVRAVQSTTVTDYHPFGFKPEFSEFVFDLIEQLDSGEEIVDLTDYTALCINFSRGYNEHHKVHSRSRPQVSNLRRMESSSLGVVYA